MLSIPLIPPGLDFDHIHLATFRPRLDSPPSPGATIATHNWQHARQFQQRRAEHLKLHNSRSPIALLTADESAIAGRKAAIRNFGACWIRPLGVSKTLQATMEEEAERVAVEEQARQRPGFRDLWTQQQVFEPQERVGQRVVAERDDQEEQERDLEEEIPSAPEAGADVSSNEESILERSSPLDDAQQRSELREEEDEVREAVELEEAELMGVTRDEGDLGIERDLDDSVLEAEIFQRTDTEAEDTDSDRELQGSFAIRGTRRLARVERSAEVVRAGGSRHQSQAQLQSRGGWHVRVRAQAGAVDAASRGPGRLHLSNSILESSFLGSSRVMRGSEHAGRARSRRRGRRAYRAPQGLGTTGVWR